MEVKFTDHEFGEISYTSINLNKVATVMYFPNRGEIQFSIDQYDAPVIIFNEDLLDQTVEDLYNEAKQQLNK